jgi:hypothetical protein
MPGTSEGRNGIWGPPVQSACIHSFVGSNLRNGDGDVRKPYPRYSFLRLRVLGPSPTTRRSIGTSNASQTRRSVKTVQGLPASIICQWRTLNPYEIMSS